MKHLLHPFLTLSCLGLCLSCGEDRSGEQPFAPTVQTLDAIPSGCRAELRGVVTSSPNSSLTECGFHYGNETLRKSVTAEPAWEFSAMTDTLQPGHYYVTTYATNGMGTTNGDTLYFDIEP